ncbi:hypothetical protein [Botrimarina sp.]|uniref:hypothetical protein n=1 Tax=Botrimarina sp. TaxID=2795802 RepID=UPI0032ED59A6
MDWKPGCGLPGPDEISEACAAIRATWDEATRAKRAVVDVQPVELAIVRVAELGE